MHRLPYTESNATLHVICARRMGRNSIMQRRGTPAVHRRAHPDRALRLLRARRTKHTTTCASGRPTICVTYAPVLERGVLSKPVYVRDYLRPRAVGRIVAGRKELGTQGRWSPPPRRRHDAMRSCERADPRWAITGGAMRAFRCRSPNFPGGTCIQVLCSCGVPEGEKRKRKEKDGGNVWK